MDDTHTIERLVDNARAVGRKESQHVAMAASLVGIAGVRSLCCWCADEHAPGAPCWRLDLGGECDRCPYIGHDCLVVAT